MEIPPLSTAPLQISTSSLIATLHQTFTNSQFRSLRIDSTSLVVLGPNFEELFISSIWEHGFRRSEDQALLVVPTHVASPTGFFSAVSSFPNVDPAVLQALNVISPFLTALTPANLSTRFHNGLAVSFSLNSNGDIVSTRLSLSQDPFLSLDQLLHLPSKKDNRVFDVFYHLLLAESETRAAYLSLKSSPEEYDLLKKSGTYKLPDWVLFSDDHALAKDWNEALRQCGFKGESLRGVLSVLSGILLMGNTNDSNDVAEGASLIGIDPETLKKHTPQQLITASYIALVENVVTGLNKFLSTFDMISEDNEKVSLGANGDDEEDLNEVVSVVSIVECAASSHKRAVLKNAFDNGIGINNELKEDGVKLSKTPASVTRALRTSSSTQFPQIDAIAGFRSQLDSSYAYLSSDVAQENLQYLDIGNLVGGNRVWTVLNISPCADALGHSNDVWSSPLVSQQVREFFVTEWATKKRNLDFSADFDFYEFLEKFATILPANIGVFNLEEWARQEKHWGPGEFLCGTGRIWLSEDVWRDLELGLENAAVPAAVAPPPLPPPPLPPIALPFNETSSINSNVPGIPQETYSISNPFETQSARFMTPSVMQEQPLLQHSSSQLGVPSVKDSFMQQEPTDAKLESEVYDVPVDQNNAQDYLDDDDEPYDDAYYIKKYQNDIEQEAGGNKKVEVVEMSSERKVWVFFVWLLTFWVPSPFLKYIMQMKRPEVRMAWREKAVLCFIIALINGGIIFYMIFLGKMICPNYDKVWNAQQLSTHQGTNDFYVGIHGNVYDITNFYRQQHSDNGIPTSATTMMPFAGLDLSDYFPPPLTVACPALVSDISVVLSYNNTIAPYAIAMHSSGNYSQPNPTTVLNQFSWYDSTFKPFIKQYYKGRLVETTSYVKNNMVSNGLYVVIIDNQIYDLTNYFLTTALYPASASSANDKWNFFPSTFVNMIENYNGEDITSQFYGPSIDSTTRANVLNCLNNAFIAGEVDFRNSLRCQASNYILLAMAGILTFMTLVKFLASIRFGGKKRPSPQDKFVICQIPAYTESEDALRLAVDSLTSLKYDNRRKLLFVICDGMIVGSGNDRPTPRIVLDLFGVDDKVDPPALPYFSIGEGANQLNFGKVYSGLYEYEGNVVPFLVVVKVGRPNETYRPGNRGKRDSQIMLMNFLNHVHYQKPMAPLELEIFHQLNNVVGIDPELYEYLLMVDADTSVSEDALTRLVASCTNDSKIAGTCGETGLQNEEKSWATMIQVYEYFISHHLTKAFESLFGTVTCLPGCFSLYRLRTNKKYKPLIISNEVIKDYSIINVDTLHRKNLFSLGEDRYLTTLMAKHFPKMKLTFVADAHAQTAAPEEFQVLLSQRRRWINSTVHNLLELLRLNNMCGFCCFGMRGVVFVDLIGTVMLPSVVVYLGYLIYIIASKSSPLPIISITLIAAVYGLQALVFILRRQWQHIGWMLIYLLAYPIHSFLLPIYSFWNMDNFTWGNTRIVVGEKGGKQLVAVKDEGFDPSVVQLETWRSFATRNGYPGVERQIVFDERKGRLQNTLPYSDTLNGYDMQELTPYGNRKSTMMEDQYSHLEPQAGGGGGMSIYSAKEDFSRPPTLSNRPLSGYGASEVNRTVTPYNGGSRPVSRYGAASIGAQSRMSVGSDFASRPVSAGANQEPGDTYNSVRESAIGQTIRTVLHNADLENMTKRELRERVQEIMGIEFTGDKLNIVDRLIDDELERMEDEDDRLLGNL